MEDFFIIPIKDIDSNWMMHGFECDFYALEYCERVLDIPMKHIQEAFLNDKGLEIHLFDIDEAVDEDWYIQLVYLSMHKNVS